MIKNNQRSILVTGTTGTAGSFLLPLRLQIILLLGQPFTRKLKRTSFGVIIVKEDNFDYNKPETVADALGKVDNLFLLPLPASNISRDISNVVKEAKKNSIKYIVKLSVMGADLEPGTTIGRLHRQEEKIIEESGIPYTFLRPNGFMQNFVNYIGQIIRNQNAFYLPRGGT